MTCPHGTTLTRESSLLGIAADVLNRPPQMLFIPNESVVTFVLPKVPRLLQGAIDPPRTVLLPTSHDQLERMRLRHQRTHDYVGVIGHHHIATKLVVVAI